MIGIGGRRRRRRRRVAHESVTGFNGFPEVRYGALPLIIWVWTLDSAPFSYHGVPLYTNVPHNLPFGHGISLP